MAMIHLISHSKRVSAAGIVAGAPYGCQVLTTWGNEHACGAPFWPNSGPANPTNYGRIKAYLLAREKAGLIDSLSNLKGKPAWLFRGSNDAVVYAGPMKATARQVRNLGMNVTTVFDIPAEHGWVVNAPDMPFPGSYYGCAHYGEPFIMNCNYKMSHIMLRHLYPERASLNPMVRRPPGYARMAANIRLINQAAYAPGQSPARHSLGSDAYVYVPTDCWSDVTACALHIHYHGCGGAIANRDPTSLFWIELPYLAETNRIVILYPQAIAMKGNENGCWDWWGITGKNFDTKQGPQISTVIAMAADLPNAIWNGERVSNGLGLQASGVLPP